MAGHSLETAGDPTNSFALTFRETSDFFYGNDDFTADQASQEYDDSNPSGDSRSLSIGPEGHVEGCDRFITASLANILSSDLKEHEIHSPPLRGGFAREYYSRLQFAEADLSFAASRARAGVRGDRLRDETEVLYFVDESVLSELWALLVCIKLACVTKARRWANLFHFAEIWRGTENCLFKPATWKREPDENPIENHNREFDIESSAISTTGHEATVSNWDGALDEAHSNQDGRGGTRRNQNENLSRVQRTKSQ